MTGERQSRLRIAVVGAYGNGKPTLTTELSQQLGLPRTHGTAMRDPAGGSGKSLEECTESELIQLAVRRFTERAVDEARLSQGFISDGSVLHEWVYTKVRLVLGRHSSPPARLGCGPRSATAAAYEEVVDHIGLLTRQHALDAYALVVHLPAEVPLSDGHRPISEHFRQVSDQLLLETLAKWRTPVHVVTGSIQDRVRRCRELAGAPPSG
ncbi:nicotinamide riboside kinase [Streptomyces sp. SAI-126]|uniref:AAA family ATPase n=1 Tax=unclassified Streptomyces TaxID=2593676 RepID=UPI0024770FD1|nr:AAA family ATPase [Streptomyces sp. SAI-119]MDH6455551.1 nicotinamide riboside kinase [Streptomyces sp. SAI-119]